MTKPKYFSDINTDKYNVHIGGNINSEQMQMIRDIKTYLAQMGLPNYMSNIIRFCITQAHQKIIQQD